MVVPFDILKFAPLSEERAELFYIEYGAFLRGARYSPAILYHPLYYNTSDDGPAGWYYYTDMAQHRIDYPHLAEYWVAFLGNNRSVTLEDMRRLINRNGRPGAAQPNGKCCNSSKQPTIND